MIPREYLEPLSYLGYPEHQEFLDDQVLLIYRIPLSQMIGNFFDRLNSATSGYASIEYKIIGHEPCDLVKVIFHLNGEPVDALTFLVYREKARQFSLHYARKLKTILPPQQFAVAIQAKIGGKIICRESIKALRKDVTAKLYGGDNTRRTKLLDKQKKGKIIMRQLGKINVNADVFFKLLKR